MKAGRKIDGARLGRPVNPQILFEDVTVLSISACVWEHTMRLIYLSGRFLYSDLVGLMGVAGFA
jgi:hypothetical protein